MSALEHALIFDVDGTLVDSNDAHAAAWSDALREFDLPREPAVIRPFIGMGGDKLLPRLVGVASDGDLGRQIVARRAEIFRDVYFDHLSAFGRVRELFERLAGDGVRLAIASSARRAELEALLEVAGVRDLIDRGTLTSADDVDASKPDPDAVQAALARLGVEPGSAIMVGDTPYDIEAAHRAGIGAIAFRCGGRVDADLADALVIYDGPGDMLASYGARQWDWPDAADESKVTRKMKPVEDARLRLDD
jgi:HAD superfamily hydrolase (TIGR01549 family)